MAYPIHGLGLLETIQTHVYLFTFCGFATSSERQFLYQEVITFVSNKSFNNFTIFEVFCYPVLGKTKTISYLPSCPSKTAFYHSNLKLWCVQEGHRCTPKQPIRFQVSFGWAIIIRTSSSGHCRHLRRSTFVRDALSSSLLTLFRPVRPLFDWEL